MAKKSLTKSSAASKTWSLKKKKQIQNLEKQLKEKEKTKNKRQLVRELDDLLVDLKSKQISQFNQSESQNS